jgi:hypothetical protein
MRALFALGVGFLLVGASERASAEFLSPDPLGYQDQMNLYTYVHNNPLNYTDPTGESSLRVRFADQRISNGMGGHFPQWVSQGHSGVVAINDQTGRTRYREYGRYNNTSGTVRTPPARPTISDFALGSNGVPTVESVEAVLGDMLAIGAAAGSDDLIVEFNLGGDYDAMVEEMGDWENTTWLPGHTCHDFCHSVINAGGDTVDSVRTRLNPDNISDVAQEILQVYEDNPDWQDQ